MKNSMMKKRIMSVFASAVFSISAVSGTITAISPMANPVTNAYAAETSVKINTAVGYAEGLYATWGAVSGASGYNVYVDGTQIDSELIRQYSGYMRADAVGLKAGSHTIKVVPIIGGSPDASKASEATARVFGHDRNGFAFNNGKNLGAYNGDGTLKSGAVVVYVTNENKNSVKATIGGTSATGLQNIVNAAQDSSAPVCIRCIGNITDPSTLDKGDLLIDKVKCGITIQGIGSDTTFNGFGIRIKGSSDVEIANIGLMNCDSSEGDAVGLQQDNNHVWVHNCDFFYGAPGSDADQVKGDGALDTKKSQYVTHSYNHFWDCGKTHLNGNGDTTLNYITYHHNWYDHSDSRHPLVRVSSAVHCYNNLYDGVAKYGMIARLGSSVFAESNYFKDTNNPILISQQGTDIADGDPIASDAGGMIKSFGNMYDKTTAPVTHKDSATNFDCYEASSASEKVPSTYKTVKGGSSYSNFDTASGMYSYSADSTSDVPSIVMAQAGRLEGGDFKWTFDSPSDDRDYDVNSALKSALQSYDDSIKAIGSGFKDDVSNPPASNPVTTAKPSTPSNTTTAKVPSQTTPAQTSPSIPSVSGGQVHNFTANGTSSSFFNISGNLSTSKGSVSYDSKTLTQCLKMESATSISFNAGSAGKLTLVFVEPSATFKVDGTKYTASNGIATVDLSTGVHTITKADTANLFYMIFGGSVGSSSPQQTTPARTTAVNQNPSQPVITSVVDIPAPVVPSGDIKVEYAGGWNEMAYLVCSGLNDASVTGVSYSGASNGELTGDDFKYLVRDVAEGVRVDILGLTAGTYSITLETSKGKVTQSGITVGAQDRSGYAHFNYNEGVGAYTDNGILKANAKILYITENNKNTVTVTSKDGTSVTGIGNILNSSGQNTGNGQTSKGGKPNTNSGIIKKLAEDGTPLVIRIIGNVSAPEGVTAYDSVDLGGSVGDNGFMARMSAGKDVTIEGVGNDATINGWGIHFMATTSSPEFGKSFEVRNIAFKNVPEDCLGMEGVQEGDNLVAPVERCWIHNCEFYVPHVSNPAESDKAEGDGACDFKRGQYFTNSYCYYEGYHKTNLVGASDSNYQYHLTYHHNYWKNCESRGPLARQANIHMYNNVFDGQTSYCQNPRANAFIFSEYNVMKNSKDPVTVKSGGVVKSYKDAYINVKGDQQANVVSSKSEKVSSSCKFANFDTNSSVSYIPSGKYSLATSEGEGLFNLLSASFETDGGCMDNMKITSGVVVTPPASTSPATTTTVPTKPVTTTVPADSTNPAITLIGDANCDGKVSIADATAILQHLGNHDKYGLSAQGIANADVSNKGDGITTGDAIAIKKYDAQLISSLPETL